MKSFDFRNRRLTVFFLVLGIGLLWMINKYWISPDEYLYVTLGRSFAAAVRGKLCLECIDSAHTPMLPFLISIGYFIAGIDSIIFYRLISVGFTLGTIYLIYLILKETIENQDRAFLALFGIFLFPGFFTFTEKVNVDILALFFSSLVLYLLINKSSYWKVSVALIFVFLSKEYTMVFSVLAVLFTLLLDYLKNGHTLKKTFLNLLVVLIPLLVVVMVFVAGSWLPYPRMLDNLILEVVGDKYIIFGQVIRNIFFGSTILPQASVVSGNVVTNIIDINFVNVFTKESIIDKVWKLYVSCFRESDINLIAIPLVTLGLFFRMKVIIENIVKKYQLVRSDIILILYFVVVMYFNFRVSDGDHGFRIIFPLIIPFIYYIYYGFEAIIEKKSRVAKYVFTAMFLFVLFLYFKTTIIVFPPVGNYFGLPVLRLFFTYKNYINGFLYTSLALIVINLNIIKYKKKMVILSGVMVLFCLYKVLPFAVNKIVSDNLMGEEYDLSLSQSWLSGLEKDNSIVATNLKSYQFYYYSGVVKLPNIDRLILPIVRRYPREVYSNRMVYSDNAADFTDISFYCKNAVDFVFYYQPDGDFTLTYEKIQKLDKLTRVYEYYYPANNRYNWGLYKLNKDGCKFK